MSERSDGNRGGWGRLRPRSIRARVTTGAVVTLILITGLSLSLSSFLIREISLTQARDQADDEARQVSERIATERYQGAIPDGETVLRVQVVDWETGEVVAATDAMEGKPPVTDKRPEAGDFRLQTTVCGDIAGPEPRDCLLVVGYGLSDSVYGEVLVLAAARSPSILGTSLIEAVLVGTSVAFLVITATVIWFWVGRALRPVERISAQLDKLSVTDLNRRLPVPGTHDEIAHLARTANASLARLDEAVTRQRRFVSDASHELRNPIAGMRAKLEVELSDPDPDARSRELLLTGLLSDTERLENIVSDLLELARLDKDVAREREEVDLAALIREEFVDERRHPALRVHSSGPVRATVNRLRLVRVLTNLVANAERHASSRIDIVVERDGDAAVVEVHDDGTGIPSMDRERIFERFARLKESRERDPGGSGLGLPISREIVQSHGGSLVAGDSDLLGGAVFTLRIPDTAE
ncbi:sensor histidine kinase [Nocardiopsis sp. NPDC101807]|uniref:sensor histidine kinase n=1 Tax=Nocardiopsis sp. NPDC101807 TaxID=3364339 RepID=UPI00382604DA